MTHTKLFEDVDESLAVVLVLTRIEAAHDSCVAGEFSVGAVAGEGEPQHRVEPVQCLQGEQEPVFGEVAAFEVGQLVQQDVAELMVFEFVEQLRGSSSAGRSRPNRAGAATASVRMTRGGLRMAMR